MKPLSAKDSGFFALTMLAKFEADVFKKRA
jgi:hypothetical protein